MSDIDQSKLRRLDLTGLLIFLGLMRHGKAVDVAADLNLTQSTISHGLKRLRTLFDDELFLRRPHGLEPTALAVELEPNIRVAVESLSDALKGPDEFDPKTSQHAFRLGAAYDLEMLTVVPPLIERVKKYAPRVTLSAGAIPRPDTLRKLNSTELDVALGYYWDEMRHLKSEPLFRQNYKLVMRREHPLVNGAVSLSKYCDADHLVVSQALDFKGIVDSTLAQLNQKRRVSVVVSSFASGFLTLERSDMVATVPERIAASLAGKFNLHVTSPPIDIRTFTVSMVTHERNEKNPAINWLAEQIRAVCASVS